MKCPNCKGENHTRGDRVYTKAGDGSFIQRHIKCNNCNCEFLVTEAYSTFKEAKSHAKR